MYDLVIVGAGPGGLNSALECEKAGLKYLVLEQGIIANTISKYPQNKNCQVNYGGNSEGNKGLLFFEEMVREELMNTWAKIGKDLNIKENEPVKDVIKEGDFFKVFTNKGEYEAKRVILAIGVFGAPNKLAIDGECQANVSHWLKNPKDFSNKKILVVGGGDSAVEAALMLSKSNDVTLSYRKDAFFRLTDKNASDITASRVNVIFKSNIVHIKDDEVRLDIDGEIKDMRFDYVFILLGFSMPKDFLERIGVKLEEGKPALEGYESSVKGLYLIGDVAKKGKFNIINAINQSHEIIEVLKDEL